MNGFIHFSDFVIQIVIDEYNITRNDLKGRSRKKQIREARQLFTTLLYYHAYSKYRVTLEQIGDLVGVGHSTVLHSKDTVVNMIATDIDFSNRMDKLQRKVKEWQKNNQH
jgi:chromosomal replication initiator protein